MTFLIIEYSSPNFLENNYSGTSKCGFNIFNYFNKLNNTTCYYASYQKNNIKNMILIDNIDYDIKYDLVIINGVPDYDFFIEQKKKFDNTNNLTKYICISNGQYYNDDFLNEYFHKVIYASKYNYDLSNVKNKCIIYNPIDESLFNDININNKHIENSIVISYNSSKGNMEYFLDNIYPLIKKTIKDFKVYISEPKYIYPNNIKKENYIDENIIFLGYLSFKELFKLYKKIPVSWDYPDIDETCPYNAMEHLLYYINIISPMNDGTKYICSKDYYNKFRLKYKINNDEDEQIANIIIDRIINYNNYKNNLINEHNYILNNFNSKKILDQYNKEIIEVLKYE